MNEGNFGWKANKCLLQKSHPAYECPYGGAPDDSSDLQVKDDPAGAISNTKNSDLKKKKAFIKSNESGKGKFGEKTPEFLAAVEKAHQFKKYSEAVYLPDDAVPATWDWRNIGGYDFTDDLRDQAKCGSCYTFSFVQSVNARLKIKYADQAKEIPKISAQHLLACNYLGEACHGGQSYFNGLWA